MLTTTEIARDILNGDLEVIDLINDIEFLEEINKEMKKLSREEDAWSDLSVARKRKSLIKKIEGLV